MVEGREGAVNGGVGKWKSKSLGFAHHLGSPADDNLRRQTSLLPFLSTVLLWHLCLLATCRHRHALDNSLARVHLWLIFILLTHDEAGAHASSSHPASIGFTLYESKMDDSSRRN